MVIGRALMSLPRTLLSDEPSGGLAPRFVQEIARIMCDGEIVSTGVPAEPGTDYADLTRSYYL